MADHVLEVTELSVASPAATAAGAAARSPPSTGSASTIAPGEIVGLVGESGSGKSTTARVILRLVPSSGRIVLHGVDISTMGDRQLRPHRRHVQMVFQDPYSSLDPAMTVGRAVGEADAARRRQALAPPHARGSPSCWSRSGSAASTSTATQPSSPAVSASGSPSPGRWRATRR